MLGGGISIWQLLIVLAIIVLIFGTKKLRNMGQDLGGALKGFKKAVKDDGEESEAEAIVEDVEFNEVSEEKIPHSKDDIIKPEKPKRTVKKTVAKAAATTKVKKAATKKTATTKTATTKTAATAKKAVTTKKAGAAKKTATTTKKATTARAKTSAKKTSTQE